MLLTNGAKDAADGLPPHTEETGRPPRIASHYGGRSSEVRGNDA